MVNKQMIDNYDVAGWLAFYADHPSFRRSVGADGDNWTDSLPTEGDDAFTEAQIKTLGEFDSPAALATAHLAASEENWRAPFVPEDDPDGKVAKQMERFTLPIDYGNAFREQQTRISGGELLKPLGKDATEDDLKAFREQQGIPLEAKAYLENLPEGLVIGEEDLPLITDFVEGTHALNLMPTQVHGIIKFQNELSEKMAVALDEADEKAKTENEDVFREEWGTEYRKNTNLIASLIMGSFGMKAEDFAEARLADGTKMFNSPDVLRAMIGLSRVINPTGQLVEGDHDAVQSMEDRLKELKQMMRDDRPAWNADTGAQDEFQKIVKALKDIEERSAQAA